MTLESVTNIIIIIQSSSVFCLQTIKVVYFCKVVVLSRPVLINLHFSQFIVTGEGYWLDRILFITDVVLFSVINKVRKNDTGWQRDTEVQRCSK